MFHSTFDFVVPESSSHRFQSPILFHSTDGLGYYDDGEERLGDEEPIELRQRNKRGSTALTAAALKKARKTNALLHTTDDVPTSNTSMWDFVQRGATTQVSRTTSRLPIADLDSLLQELDVPRVRRTGRQPHVRPTTLQRVVPPNRWRGQDANANVNVNEDEHEIGRAHV